MNSVHQPVSAKWTLFLLLAGAGAACSDDTVISVPKKLVTDAISVDANAGLDGAPSDIAVPSDVALSDGGSATVDDALVGADGGVLQDGASPDDGVAPDEWVAWEFAKTKRHFVKLGSGADAEIEWFDGPHAINGAGTYDFLDRHLDPEGTLPRR